MDLYEIEVQANNVKKYLDLLIAQYKETYQVLINIYNICYRYNLYSKNLVDLINKYKKMISVLSDEYKSISNKFLKYVEYSNRNLEELAIGVANSVQIFKDIL